jgi:molybdopterin-guanine dinucleotide biosynthesis protein A
MPSSPPLYGLVLAGGLSTRMQRDKAALEYHGKPQLQWAFELLNEVCELTFVSVRPDQRSDPHRMRLPQVVDGTRGRGPIAGIAAAQAAYPDVAWLVVACDLPFLTVATLQTLIAQRDSSHIATAYRSAHDGLPEPLCAIWEPASRLHVSEWIDKGKDCPRKLLINSNAHIVEQRDRKSLDNVNTPAEFASASVHVGTTPKRLRLQYYALFREQAGKSEEEIETTAVDSAQLYDELRIRHGFKLAREQLKVAVNAEFCGWNTQLKSGDSVVFIPPVAGG